MATLDDPGSNPPKLASRQEGLLQDLDTHYEQYLGLLDQYQCLRDNLSKRLALGFMGLAQANFNTANRMRYGVDQYDQRMQASRIVHASVLEHDIAGFSIATTSVNDSADPSKTSKAQNRTENGPLDSSIPEDPSIPQEKEDEATVPSDPIRWFGILVPQALRVAQSHFVEALQQNVAQLTSVDAQMEALEIQIQRVKKRMSKTRS